MRVFSLLLLLVGVGICAYLAWRPSPFLSEVWWIPHEFARWADGQFNLRTAIPFTGLGLLAVFVFGGCGKRLWVGLLVLALFGIILEVG